MPQDAYFPEIREIISLGGLLLRRLFNKPALFLLFMIVSPVHSAQVLLNQNQQLPVSYTFGPEWYRSGSELIIRGQNTSIQLASLLIRIESKENKEPSSNVQHFSLPAGEFQLVVPFTGLRTSKGNEPLLQPYAEIRIESPDNQNDITLDRIVINTDKALPEQTLALDFGHSGGQIFPKFTLIEKKHYYLEGTMKMLRSRSGDPLIQDGISGIDLVQIPWPDGLWRLSLWVQDQGRRQYIPHFLQRTITANDTIIHQHSLTQDQWIKNNYLAGKKQEAVVDGNLWSLIGRRRDGFISKLVKVKDGLLNIRLYGDSASRYLAGLVLEPPEGRFAEGVQENRRHRYLLQWPIVDDRSESKPVSSGNIIALQDISQQIKNNQGEYLAAQNMILNLAFEVHSTLDDRAPMVVIPPPRAPDKTPLNVSRRYGHWRYERPTPDAKSLIVDDSYLRSDMENIRFFKDRPRRLHIQVHIPDSVKPGVYHGEVQVLSHGILHLKKYTVRVMPILLPKLEHPIGLYIESAPFYQWFSGMENRQLRAVTCDLSLMANHGFSTVAPSFAIPSTDAGRQRFIKQLNMIKKSGFTGTTLAYSPLKQLVNQKGESKAGVDLLNLKRAMASMDLPEIYWSTFEEPNLEQMDQARSKTALLKHSSLGFKTAGHMNSEHQSELAKKTDLILMSHGMNTSTIRIQVLRQNSMVWLYNFPDPRLAAGFYQWRVGADGYLQWHGRMPEADPFDPTDGEAGDTIYLYPDADDCRATPDIHRRFLDLHEATLDLRWLQWLQNDMASNQQAVDLVRSLQKRVPGDWQQAHDTLSSDEILELREDITRFALSTVSQLSNLQPPLFSDHKNTLPPTDEQTSIKKPEPTPQRTENQEKAARLLEGVYAKDQEIETEITVDTKSSFIPRPLPTGFYLQAGSFKIQSNADRALAMVKAEGFNAYIQGALVRGTHFYRVLIGPDLTLEGANRLRKKLGHVLPFMRYAKEPVRIVNDIEPPLSSKPKISSQYKKTLQLPVTSTSDNKKPIKSSSVPSVQQKTTEQTLDTEIEFLLDEIGLPPEPGSTPPDNDVITDMAIEPNSTIKNEPLYEVGSFMWQVQEISDQIIQTLSPVIDPIAKYLNRELPPHKSGYLSYDESLNAHSKLPWLNNSEPLPHNYYRLDELRTLQYQLHVHKIDIHIQKAISITVPHIHHLIDKTKEHFNSFAEDEPSEDSEGNEATPEGNHSAEN
ncbi:SPOR domain-containing protein [Endozoicomonas ascidiicola]|uniref:SPOR domain-containing protein n=1 Tax=Endozoicomonas ascidiicola TaxID=1698521 RepID=UPI00082DC47C|nr:SPOR domain-containing protein [Endozoicomonas ascidiicola]